MSVPESHQSGLPDGGARRVLSELRGWLPSLPEGDKQAAVIAYVIARPDHVGAASITELASELDVSESTIVKVCKKVGLNGFKDLKRMLNGAPTSRADSIADEIDPADDHGTVVAKMFANAMEDVQDTLASLDIEELGRAVEAVARADRIACYGVGGSGPLALDANHKFLLTGMRTEAYTDSHLAAMSAAMLTDRDVALVFSYSGETKAINGIVGVAKQRGATTICITSHRHTTLTKLADISLFASAREQPMTGENSAVRMVQKLVLDCLFACVIKDDQARVQEAFRRSTSAIEEV